MLFVLKCTFSLGVFLANSISGWSMGLWMKVKYNIIIFIEKGTNKNKKYGWIFLKWYIFFIIYINYSYHPSHLTFYLCRHHWVMLLLLLHHRSSTCIIFFHRRISWRWLWCLNIIIISIYFSLKPIITVTIIFTFVIDHR